ncbi:MAG: lysylphosphatidylglycerol synthase transmembrane domain-containing protein [Myxococcota bacterium]
MGRATRITVILVVTAACLAAALWNIDPIVAAEAFTHTRWWMLLPMWALYLVAHSLRVWRLGLLLPEPVPFRQLFSINSVGFLAINVIPLRLGEMVRPWLLAERRKIPFAASLAAIFIERLLDMVMLLLMLLGVTWLVALPEGGLVIEGVDVIQAGQRFAGIIALVGTLAGAVLIWVGEPLIHLLELLPMGGLVAGFARKFREGFVQLARQPSRAILLLSISASIWAVTIAAIGVFMGAFPGVPTGVSEAWSTWAITLSGMVALPTPGFFGSFELFCSSALWLLWGVERALAGSFAIALHIGQFTFTVGLGAAFLVVEGLSIRDLVQPIPEAVE